MKLEKGFDNIGLVDTVRHFPSLPDEDKIPQRFIGHFISQQLYSTTSYKWNDTLSGSYQYGGTLSLSTINHIGRRIEGGIYLSGLERWSWHRFRGKGEASNGLKLSTYHYPPIQEEDQDQSITNTRPISTTSIYCNATE